MGLEQIVKDKIAIAPFGSDEKNIYRLILGELAYAKHKDGTFVLKELLKQNEISMRRCRNNPQEMKRINLENKLLKSLLGQE